MKEGNKATNQTFVRIGGRGRGVCGNIIKAKIGRIMMNFLYKNLQEEQIKKHKLTDPMVDQQTNKQPIDEPIPKF